MPVNRGSDPDMGKQPLIKKGPEPNKDPFRYNTRKQVRGAKVMADIEAAADKEQVLAKLPDFDRLDVQNGPFLEQIRRRLDSAGVQLPKVEVCYQELTVQARCFFGARSLPSIYNSIRHAVEATGLLSVPSAKMTIVNGASGIIKPGRMTLLLGPPGSGKTTLLLALAGSLESNLKVRGKVKYNGRSLDQFVPQKVVSYVSQHDLHAGEMTVKETLEFSARFQGVGSRDALLRDLGGVEDAVGTCSPVDAEVDAFMKAAADEKLHSPVVSGYVLKALGLDVCSDTMVGDQMRRGISGGQRKRVTTGEVLVGPNRVLLMDEISTGLDSSTTYQILRLLQDFVHIMEGTVIISLLQSAPETYELFDDVLLISEGQVVYHGPRDSVLEFFESCGFKCPDRKGVADFLQEVTSRKDQQQYWVGEGEYRYVTVKEFGDLFSVSDVGRKLSMELSEQGKSVDELVESRGIGTWEMLKAAFQREWLLMRRNSFVYVVKSVQIVIVGLITGTVFLRTTTKQETVDDGTLCLGSLFFGLITIMFNGLAELSMTIVRLPVFFKHRDLKFYPAWAFSLPRCVLSIPLSAIECLAWTLVTYFTIGYSVQGARFFKQFFLLWVLHQMSSALFRFLAGLCRSQVVSNTAGAFSLLIFFVLGGFVIPRTQIPSWWTWGYWISPLAYGQNAISVNELLAPRWDKPFLDSTIGKAALSVRGIFTSGSWYYIGLLSLFGFAVFFNLGFTLALTYLKPFGRRQAFVSEETLAQLHANQQGKQYQPAGAAVVVRPVTGSAKKHGMTLPFQPLTMSFKDVNYFVDRPSEMKQEATGGADKLQLLKGITGAFRPGVLTALMGVSGAGKTTLMDVLAGRKTGGQVEGDVRISGFPKKQETFARVSGYCEQNDIHSPQLTVFESLVFSAQCRLPQSTKPEVMSEFIEEVMRLVELDILRDALVGIPGVTGLSTEQRKRLTIAVELVANPSIIFMDEPTSGLDARAAAIVMRTVRNIVETGRTIVCTIHQPSIDIFEAFDELFLMKTGGQLIYAGPLGHNSETLVKYLEAVPGVPGIRDGQNPAAWMLDVTSSSIEQSLGVDFADIYHKSTIFHSNVNLVNGLSSPLPGAEDLNFPTQYSKSFFGQLLSCLWKQNLTYWRSPDYNSVRICFTLVGALLFGSIFWMRGQHRETEADLLTVMGALYASTIFLGIQNSATVQPVIGTERTVFYRERAAGMYAAVPYALSQVLVEFPYILLQTVLYGPITYAMIGFQWSVVKFAWYCFVLLFTFMYFTYYGMMTMALTPNHELAAVVAAAFYSVFNLFSGFMIPRPKLPGWWQWYYWICPVAWTVNGLITSQYGDDHGMLTLADGSINVLSQFLEDCFGFHYDFLGTIAAVLVGFSVFFAFMFAFSIKVLNFQRR